MKALVTGASGFIGRNLAEALLLQNWSVRLLVHQTLPPVTERFEIVRGDIREKKGLEAKLEGVDILYHLAAALGGSRIPKKEFFRINARGTEHILKAAQDAGIKRVVHVSSAGVLGSVAENTAVGEDHPPAPIDVYDKSKREGERIALEFAASGLDVVVIRPGWVYGPGDRRTLKLFHAIARGRFALVAKGRTRQTPVYIDDLIRGILLCDEKGRQGEIYHLAGCEVLSVREIANTIASVLGKKRPRLSLPGLPVRVAAWKMGTVFSLFNKEAPLTPGKLTFFLHPKPLAIDKAAQELGYSPQVNFLEGAARTVGWYRAHGWL